MASEDTIARLRRMAGETEDDKYSDTILEVMLAENGDDLAATAAAIWGEKASDYADLVNMSEAGSSRSNSDLFKHAKEQQTYFADLAAVAAPTTGDFTTTRRIERA